MIFTRKQMKFRDEVDYIVTELERVFLRGKEPYWKTTREFSELYDKYYDYSYRLIRAAADSWNKDLSNQYGAMFDCDFHGFRWRFHKTAPELKDLCWISAIRTDSHNKRSLDNFGFAGIINSDVKNDVKIEKVDVIMPNSAKNYEDDES